MTITDPIGDFLTRIRNGLAADHDSVAIPHSRFKVELARILKEQGYIETYGTEPGDVGEVLRVTLKYTEDRDTQGAGRHGHRDRVDLEGRHDRPRRAPQGGRRRGRGLRLVIGRITR